MRKEIRELIREGARLYRFVEQVEFVVRDSKGVRAYPRESDKFLDFVLGSADGTKGFLDGLPLQNDDISDEELEDFHGVVADLWQAWTLLHEFVKPVADADTLRIPTPLVFLLNRRARAILNPQKALVAVELVSALNYVQVGQVGLQKIDLLMRTVLGKKYAAPFPEGLGIIGLPYSQGPSLFTNCLLFHELGHYVFQQKKLGEEYLEDYLFQQVAPFIKDRFPQLKDDTDDTTLKSFFSIIRPWWEEVFCDLFAVRMLGPAFTCLLAELLYVIGTLGTSKNVLFGRTHPSAAIRFREQLALLETLGWQEVLRELNVSPLAEIALVAQQEIPSEPYDPDYLPSNLPGTFVAAFSDGLANVRNMVSIVTDESGAPEEEFIKEYRNVSEWLSHGVVPSVRYQPGHTSASRFVTLINGAYFFQLSSMGELFQAIDNADARKISDNTRVRQRIEEWTLKAISDLLQPELESDEDDGPNS